jgi:hypothetical protein
MDTGAYNYSMASNYNRLPRPAAVLVGQGEANLILQRENLPRFNSAGLHTRPISFWELTFRQVSANWVNLSKRLLGFCPANP